MVFTGLFPHFYLSSLQDNLTEHNIHVASDFRREIHLHYCCKSLEYFQAMTPLPNGIFCLSISPCLNLQISCSYQKSRFLNASSKPYVYVNVYVTKREPSLTVLAIIQSKDWFEMVTPVTSYHNHRKITG